MVKQTPSISEIDESTSLFLSFIEKRRVVESGSPYTHVTFDPEGSYYIKDNVFDDFMIRYCNAIKRMKSGPKITIAERPSEIMPFRVDVDLNLPSKGEIKRYYTKKRVLKIIKIIYDLIGEFVDLTNEEEYDEDVGEDCKPYKCVLLEKSSPRIEETTLKDGFHLHFPYFYVDGWTNRKLHEEIIKRMQLERIWANTPFEEFSNILDPDASVRNTWLMYGSSKRRGSEPYKATAFFDENMQEVTANELFLEDMYDRKCSAEYYLPRFLSVRNCKRATPLKKEIRTQRDSEIKNARRRAELNSVTKRSSTQAAEEIKMVIDGNIMDMISPTRAYDYSTWRQIGQALHSVSMGGEEGLELWIDFSKKWDLFKEGECELLWGKFKKSNYSIGTLLYYAKKDNPDAFKEWRKQDLDILINASLEHDKPVEWDIAQIFFKIYSNRFICASKRQKIWYEFREHRWREMDEGLEIRRAFPTEFVNTFIEYKRRLLTEMLKDSTSEERKVWLTKAEERCSTIIYNLKTSAFQTKVLDQCAMLFHNPEFMSKKDENKNLWCCENGILDLKEGVFRDGKPEDYCTYSCGLYYQEYNENDAEVKSINNFFSEVFVNQNLRNYFLDNLCSIMEGGNPNKSFILSTGDGSNGKSVTYALVRAMCGDYCITFPQELFVMGGKNSSGAARPELARVRGRRVAVVNELAKTDKINIRVLKELTGNDTFFGRLLYSGGGEIKPMFKLFMHSNEPPEMDASDEPSWERASFLACESKFVLPWKLKEWPVPKSREEQFKMKRFHADQSMIDRIEELASALLWMMFKRYKVFKQKPMVTPEEVLSETHKQRMKNDFYSQFRRDRLVKIEDGNDEDCLTVAAAHTAFISWFKETHPQSIEKISREHFTNEMIKKLGKVTIKGRSKKWVDWRLGEDEDEEDTSSKNPTSEESKT
jgi:phage/plasmid-associated DNA primase